MSRIGQRFAQLKTDNRTALVPYITAGDPVPWVTVPMLHGLVNAGADIIELGIPFSDPSVDGPVIQRACERALKHNVTIHNVLAMVEQFREKDTDTPVVLMGYANPIEIMDYCVFAKQAQQAGVDGILVVDMPPEESDALLTIMDNHEIDVIFLVSPATSTSRMGSIAKYARGFIYYVSVKGVTGATTLDLGDVASRLTLLKSHTTLPLGVGFGIRDANSAAVISDVADAVVVGSALVQCIEENSDKTEKLSVIVGNFLAGMRHAINVRDTARLTK